MTDSIQTQQSFWLLPVAGLGLAVVGLVLFLVLGGVADGLLATLWRGAWVILIVPVCGLVGTRILHDLFGGALEHGATVPTADEGADETAHVYGVRAVMFLFAFGLPMLAMRSDLFGPSLNEPASAFWTTGWLTVRYLVSAIILCGIAALLYLGISRPAIFSVGWIIAITIITVDWIMSAEAGWVSSGLPILVAGFSLLAGCAARAALANREQDVPSWAKLLIVFVLMAGFLALAHQLVVWSGDRPSLTVWYVTRLTDGWVWFQLIGILLLPVSLTILLLSGDLHRTEHTQGSGLASLHAASGLVIISVVIQSAWWVLPGHSNVLFASLFTLVMIGLVNWFIRIAVTTRPGPKEASS